MISLVQPSRGHITQFFGARQVDGNPHAGQDYAYSNGTEIFPEVYAAADGVVLFAGDARGLAWPNIMYLNIDFDRSDNVDTSAGNYAIIAHHDAAGNRIALTGYGHQEEVWVKAGDTVRAGQQIGVVGETGFSAGKHLHFDLVLYPFDVDDAPYYGRVDPNPYFVSGTTYHLNSSQLGSSTPLDEGFLMALSDQDQIEVRDNLRKLVNAADEEKAFDAGVNEKVDELVGNLRKTFWNTEESKALLASTPAPELAAQIDAAGLAAAVRDELVKLIGGK